MPIVTGPIMSLTASGSLAKTLTYRYSKGRAIASLKAQHSPSQSLLRHQQRSLLGALAKHWKDVDPIARGNWRSLAKPLGLTEINFYTRFNFATWTQNHYLTDDPQSAVDLSYGLLTYVSLTTSPRRIHFTYTNSDPQDGWLFALALDPTNTPSPPPNLTVQFWDYSNDNAPTTPTVSAKNIPPATYSWAIYRTTRNWGPATLFQNGINLTVPA